MAKNKVVVSVKLIASKNIEPLKECLHKLAGVIKFSAVSSVYKAYSLLPVPVSLKIRSDNHSQEGFTLVISGSTSLNILDFNQLLNQVAQDITSKSFLIYFDLLIFNDVVMTSPRCSVPKPDFHLIPAELIPAVEIDPLYVHPVLQRNLMELSREFKSEGWGEFFTRSETILDF